MKKNLLLFPGVVSLMLAAAPFLPTFTPAASAASDGAPIAHPHADGEVGRHFDRLNLTEAQKAQLKPIQDAARQQIEALLTPEQQQQLSQARQQHQRPNLNLSDDQKAKIEAIRQDSKNKMSAVLTPDQQQQLQQWHQQWQQRHQQPQS